MTGVFFGIYRSPVEMVYPVVETNDVVSNRIHSFGRLPEGWHYGEGRGATKVAIALALCIGELFAKRNAEEVEVFPDIDGGILVSAYRKNETIEVLCGPRGYVNILHEKDDNVVYDRKEFSVDEVDAYLRGVAWKPKKSYDCFIPDTTVDMKGVSRVWRLKTPPKAEVYRLSRVDALGNAAERNVDTYLVFTTPKSLDIPLSSGESQRINYLPESVWSANRPPAAMTAT